MAWAALPVAGVLLLAGCGDDDDGDDAQSTPSASAPATSGAPATSAAPGTSAPAGGAVDPATFTADQKAAAAAYQKVFDAKTPAADRKALIQDSAKLSTMLDAMLGSSFVSTVSIKTNDVKLSGDTGTVNFEVLVGGNPVGMPATDGTVVKQDGQWKVGAKTVCTLASYAQIPAAPECSAY